VQFSARSRKNFENRCLHHPIFGAPLIERIFEHFGVLLLRADATRTDYLALGKVRK
jgi:hypothetical protein